ncbi:MAG: helix-turn-helix domain-containing protein [Chryseolinea sp.]
MKTGQEVTKRLLVKRSGNADLIYQCSVIAAIKAFGTKWKPCILCYLTEKPMRYNELYRIIPNISRKILSEHLDELEKDELIIRTQYDDKLQKVEYSLSEKGKSLMPLLEQLQNWGMENIKGVLTIQEMLSATLYQTSDKTLEKVN